ncbi:hypothetical protein PMIN01_05153 [Paraphaeosphaeria minitans]|uniref:Uncharacterized protein n=1 Tax=Paraphaeosphaeria minitans TaxID=565426 RepID=A0A9P6GNM0_9PLEO|nr:hypothetical protein PMIN01_05153 [Paraphaeosphaeria minitans]
MGSVIVVAKSLALDRHPDPSPTNALKVPPLEADRAVRYLSNPKYAPQKLTLGTDKLALGTDRHRARNLHHLDVTSTFATAPLDETAPATAAARVAFVHSRHPWSSHRRSTAHTEMNNMLKHQSKTNKNARYR